MKQEVKDCLSEGNGIYTKVIFLLKDEGTIFQKKVLDDVTSEIKAPRVLRIGTEITYQGKKCKIVDMATEILNDIFFVDRVPSDGVSHHIIGDEELPINFKLYYILEQI